MVHLHRAGDGAHGDPGQSGAGEHGGDDARACRVADGRRARHGIEILGDAQHGIPGLSRQRDGGGKHRRAPEREWIRPLAVIPRDGAGILIGGRDGRGCRDIRHRDGYALDGADGDRRRLYRALVRTGDRPGIAFAAGGFHLEIVPGVSGGEGIGAGGRPVNHGVRAIVGLAALPLIGCLRIFRLQDARGKYAPHLPQAADAADGRQLDLIGAGEVDSDGTIGVIVGHLGRAGHSKEIRAYPAEGIGV